MSNCRLIYGTAWKKTDTARLVKTALAMGFRGIDTACQPKHYHEAGVGEAVAASLSGTLTRADLYLQTKFTPVSGQDAARIPYDPRSPLAKQVEQSFAVSLRNLQTPYVDCLILHSPLTRLQQTLDVWRAMESLAADGRARRLGISNIYEPAALEALYEAALIKPGVVQNRFHAQTGYDRDIRAFCRRRHMIYQSFWTLTANPHILAHATIARLASKYRRSPAQILFRHLTQSGVVPLTGTRSETHMREDLSIGEFELEPVENDAVQALL